MVGSAHGGTYGNVFGTLRSYKVPALLGWRQQLSTATNSLICIVFITMTPGEGIQEWYYPCQ